MLKTKNSLFRAMDAGELKLPETTYVRDIENKVFQAMVVRSLSKIKGISLIGGSIFDQLLAKDNLDRIRGIEVEQDQKKHSVAIKVEINVAYGIPIPEKSEEIQNRLTEDICSFTGLHVSCVHVIFKNLILDEETPSKLLANENK